MVSHLVHGVSVVCVLCAEVCIHAVMYCRVARDSRCGVDLCGWIFSHVYWVNSTVVITSPCLHARTPVVFSWA